MLKFNKKEIELLAPAGTLEIFKEIINVADAVYFGGKLLNMRLHRKEYNFSHDDIKEAVSLAHSLGKKAYVTVNNLHSSADISVLGEYLHFLEEVSPDAIIIQDLSIIDYIKKNNLKLNLHSSVMMDVHNVETVKALRELGVSRVVMSREVSLSDIKAMSFQTDMEFEYFIHGDMCVAHGGQCYYSGVLFNNSSNRGLCMKPCRWDYKIKKDGKVYDTQFPLAVKDMYMYEHLPELIESNVCSFKIEGRMRELPYLMQLVQLYRNAIDRYVDDPISYERAKESDVMHENRKRDFSTFFAVNQPTLDIINLRMEGTGAFYSTGKMFSYATEEKEATSTELNSLKEFLAQNSTNKASAKPQLSVKVNNVESAMLCIEKGIDNVYLSGDVFLPNKPFSKADVLSVTSNKGSTKVYLGLPHSMQDQCFSQYEHLLENDLGIDGVLATNLGAVNKFKNKYEVIVDYTMNVYNAVSAQFMKNYGASAFTMSIELPASEVVSVCSQSDCAEIIVHGTPTMMLTHIDLYDNAKIKPVIKEGSNTSVADEIMVLVDEKGFEHPVFKDNSGKNHLLPYKDICLLGVLKELYNCGISRFRIEANSMTAEQLSYVLDVYSEAIKNLDECEAMYNKLKPRWAGFTLGAIGRIN